ncbi:MAG: flagellar basal body P-ring formation chaperone FlgA [Rhodospirillaceae bacterium]
MAPFTVLFPAPSLMSAKRAVIAAGLAIAAFVVQPQSLRAAEMSDVFPNAAIELRTTVEASGDMVTLGDLFQGQVKKPSTPVLHAPEPARTAVLDANWLYRVARAYDLDWRPANRLVRVVVSRPGRSLDAEALTTLVEDTLASLGAPEHSRIVLSGGIPTVTIPMDVEPDLKVTDRRYDPSTKRFAVNLLVSTGDGNPRTLRLTGRVDPTRLLPVLVRRLGKDDVIRATDLRMKSVRAQGLPRDAIIEPEDLIGKAARRDLTDGVALRRLDVKKALMVRKDSLVTIQLNIPGLQLTAQGKAMEGGAEGEAIRVMNADSKQIVLATIVGQGQVIVSPSRMAAVR